MWVKMECSLALCSVSILHLCEVGIIFLDSCRTLAEWYFPCLSLLLAFAFLGIGREWSQWGGAVIFPWAPYSSISPAMLPLCLPRSDTPLIYKAVPSWFVRVEHMVGLLLTNNDLCYWWAGGLIFIMSFVVEGGGTGLCLPYIIVASTAISHCLL